jgi:hypothetical protein
MDKLMVAAEAVALAVWSDGGSLSELDARIKSGGVSGYFNGRIAEALAIARHKWGTFDPDNEDDPDNYPADPEDWDELGADFDVAPLWKIQTRRQRQEYARDEKSMDSLREGWADDEYKEAGR